jgi:predicted ferric reductase
MVKEVRVQENDKTTGMEFESTLNFQSMLVLLLAVFFGLVAVAYILPIWLPGITESFMGTNPKAYWYLSRGSGFIALGLLWCSMVLGLGTTNKMARIWPGIPPAMAFHEYVGLLGLFFTGFHALILLGDTYSKYQLVQLLVPFGSYQYRPVWVGLGQLGFYAWFLIVLAFYIRKAIGKNTWRVIHMASFACYMAALIHGLMSGTDAGSTLALDFYWISGGGLLFMLVYRLLWSRKTTRAPATSHRPAQG